MTKFQELAGKRLPKTVKAVSLLGNLARYPHDEEEAKALVNALLDATDDVDAIFAKRWGWSDEPAAGAPEPAPRMAAVPDGVAEGGASFEAEVRWALDAVKRGDLDLAEDRLKRMLRR